MDVLIWILLGAVVIWYWSDTSKAREMAIQHGRRACKDMNLQFLDGTVVRYSTRPKRAPGGQMVLCRDFSFEFTNDGIRRYPGHIQLLGGRLKMMDLDYAAKEQDSPSSNLILETEYHLEAAKDRTSTVISLSDYKNSKNN